MINHKLNGTINKTKLNQVRMHKNAQKTKQKPSRARRNENMKRRASQCKHSTKKRGNKSRE